MGRYLRWSTCSHCGKKITQNKTHGRWHDARGGWDAASAKCTGSFLGHQARTKAVS